MQAERMPWTVVLAGLSILTGTVISYLYNKRRLPAGIMGQFLLDLQFFLPGLPAYFLLFR